MNSQKERLHYRRAEDSEKESCGLCGYCHTELDDTLTVCNFLSDLVDEEFVCDEFNE